MTDAYANEEHETYDHGPRFGCTCLDCTQDRFWSKVNLGAEEDCWEWRGNPGVHGYGVFRFYGKSTLSHRLALSQFDPEVQRIGLLACHTCDNKICVNPSHLYWGRYEDNIRDAISRGLWVSPVSKRTHCKWGHGFTPENTIWRNRGETKIRVCASCSRRWADERKERRGTK